MNIIDYIGYILFTIFIIVSAALLDYQAYSTQQQLAAIFGV